MTCAARAVTKPGSGGKPTRGLTIATPTRNRKTRSARTEGAAGRSVQKSLNRGSAIIVGGRTGVSVAVDAARMLTIGTPPKYRKLNMQSTRRLKPKFRRAWMKQKLSLTHG